jgi:hypothetical protein|tara:strand:+ start:142 stop:288 length:147 start_codon:yes stop_codon:yes gene_type:complete
METFTDDDGVWEISMVGKRQVMKLVEPAKKKAAPKKKAAKKKATKKSE